MGRVRRMLLLLDEGMMLLLRWRMRMLLLWGQHRQMGLLVLQVEMVRPSSIGLLQLQCGDLLLLLQVELLLLQLLQLV